MDDISGKLNEIFSSPEGMEKIKNLVSMLSNSSGGPANSAPNGPSNSEASGAARADPPKQEAPAFDPSLLLKIQQAMGALQHGDPRIDLLLALKVNLSDGRRQRVDEAIQIMRMINLLPLLREQGFLGGGDG
jgi:hypothetical protein